MGGIVVHLGVGEVAVALAADAARVVLKRAELGHRELAVAEDAGLAGVAALVAAAKVGYEEVECEERRDRHGEHAPNPFVADETVEL